MKKTLEVFVDESGNFGDVRDPARFCLLTLVFHDAEADLTVPIQAYARGVFNAGADPETMTFHTAPLIRQSDQFSAMSRNMRGKLFYQMLAFVRKSGVRYRSFSVDTAFTASSEQVCAELTAQLRRFMVLHHAAFERIEGVRLHYDAGQKSVTRVLEALALDCPRPVVSVQGVRQRSSLLLQTADFLCTVSLIERRLDAGLGFNPSECRFFGSPRDFKRNVLRKVKGNEMS